MGGGGTYAGDGTSRSMGEDEGGVLESASKAKVLGNGGPAVAGIAQAVEEYYAVPFISRLFPHAEMPRFSPAITSF